MKVLAMCLFALLFLDTLSGCEKKQQESAEDQALASEQRAIQRYSDETATIDPRLKKFVDAWDEAMRNEEVDTLTSAIRQRVLPALEEVITALTSVPTDTDRLKEAHTELVSAYRDFQAAVNLFLTEIREDNRRQPIGALLQALDTFNKKEESYRTKMRAYYQQYNVTLVQQTKPVRPSPKN
ncbi:MAG: hypothetical protein HUU55_17120 [Myxococcales bacterium]|nr:hypothetical protein [Myxococcales bacterium]